MAALVWSMWMAWRQTVPDVFELANAPLAFAACPREAPAALEALRRYSLWPAAYTPCELYDSLLFTIGTMVAMLAAWCVARALARARSPAFASVRPDHKQWYVVANCSKAAALATLAFSPFWLESVHASYWLDEWHATSTRALLIKRACGWYVATDVLALLVVPKLPRTTVVHHVVAAVLALTIMATDLATADVVRMVALYGSWSTLSWPVNLFLALRVVYGRRPPPAAAAAAAETAAEATKTAEERMLDTLAHVALGTYVVTLAANWAWHVCWLWRAAFVTHTFSVRHAAYAAACVNLVRDDCILAGWLATRSFGTAADMRAYAGLDVVIKRRVVRVAENALPFSLSRRRRASSSGADAAAAAAKQQ